MIVSLMEKDYNGGISFVFRSKIKLTCKKTLLYQTIQILQKEAEAAEHHDLVTRDGHFLKTRSSICLRW